jgi:subtilisin family serine protease
LKNSNQFPHIQKKNKNLKGRNGKGTIFIWASGNGGGNGDDCSCDGYVSNWNIISIGAVNHHGMMPYFMELCPSTMAVVYSGGRSRESGKEDDPGVRVIASDVRGKCTSTFQGTSSAAPLAAGAIALVLEANPNLTYRDVMHLITKTARIPNIEETDGWIINGANFHVNEKYGFGVLDVSKMIEEAQKWQNVPPREKCVVEYDQELP